MAYATVEDLEARWRPLSAAEKIRASALLEDAAGDIDACSPLPDPVTTEATQARKVVSCEMVKRAMAAGVGVAVSQESQTRGPFNASVTYANPTGDLYLTKADKKRLGCGGPRAGNVSMLGGP